MNSRERVLRALDHQEPDRVPFDLGGTGLTTIHVTAYQNLRRHLGLPDVDVRIGHMAEQLALVDQDVADRLEVDLRLVRPGTASTFEYLLRDEGLYEAYSDEWGIGWRKPKDGGFYYDMYRHPLAGADSLDQLKAFPSPIRWTKDAFARSGLRHKPRSRRAKRPCWPAPAPGSPRSIPGCAL